MATPSTNELEGQFGLSGAIKWYPTPPPVGVPEVIRPNLADGAVFLNSYVQRNRQLPNQTMWMGLSPDGAPGSAAHGYDARWHTYCRMQPTYDINVVPTFVAPASFMTPELEAMFKNVPTPPQL